MIKRLIIVFLLIIFAAGGVLAALNQNDVNRTNSKSDRISDNGTAKAAATSRYTPGTRNSATCEGVSTIIPIIEHSQIGDTWYDYQANGSMGRMISVSSDGCRHTTWHYTAGVYGAPNYRYVKSNEAPASAAPLSWIGYIDADGGINKNAGYPNQTHLSDGTSILIYHRTAGTPTWYSSIAAEDEACGNSWNRHWDIPDYIEGATSGNPGQWPKGEAQYDPITSRDYIHVVAQEGITTGTDPALMIYERCYIKEGPGTADTMICQTFRGGATQTFKSVMGITHPSTFFTVSSFDSSCEVSPIVAVSPVSKSVAVVYTKPNDPAGSCDYFMDVWYFESNNCGNDWIDGTQWPPIKHNITQYGSTDLERADRDVAACYDYQDSLHIVWSAGVWGGPSDPTTLYYRSYLYHWSKKDGKKMIAFKLQDYCYPVAHHLDIAKIGISAQDPVYHPAGDSVYLYATWVQFDSADVSAATHGNGDLWGCGSNNGGFSWSEKYNLTTTNTNGCAAGACVAEDWSSQSANMYNGNLQMSYICDKDPGSCVHAEGAWTDNPVFYYELQGWPVGLFSQGVWVIKSPAAWTGPPLKVTPGGNRSLVFTVKSIGNANLVYSVTTDDPCIICNVGSTVLAPGTSNDVTAVINGAGACNGTFIDGNIILATNEGTGKIEYMPVQGVVANDYYECPRDPVTYDSLENYYLRFYVNANSQEWVHDIGNFPDTVHEVFFQGGPFVATTISGDTLVGRYYGNNDQHAGAQDRLHITEANDHWVVSTSNVYIHDLNPPMNPKWWWWEMSREILLFKSNASAARQHLVIEYVTVERHNAPSWWPTNPTFTGYEDTYIGSFMDIDAPYDTCCGQSGRNRAGYDATNNIAWTRGWDWTGAHPAYNDYYAGMALIQGPRSGESSVPFGTYNVRNDSTVYKRPPWGWYDGMFYQLAKVNVPGMVWDPDSIVDRSQIVTARKIPAGSDPNANYAFTIVQAFASNGLYELQRYVDTARTIVATETMRLLNMSQIDPSAFPVIKVYMDVVDVSGNPVPGLNENDFCVYQDGQNLNFQVMPLDTGYCPMSVCLVIDRSGSMYGTPLDQAKEAARRFVRNMKVYDRVAIASYGGYIDCVKTEQNFTSDTTLLINAINAVTADDNTPMFDGFWLGVNLTCTELGSKAVIGFTDGLENNSEYCWPPPDGTTDGWQDDCDSVASYANLCGFPIYSIALGSSAWPEPLMCLANNTGGNYYYAPTAAQIDSIYHRIKNRLCGRYVIVYASPDTVLNGTNHQVIVCRKDLSCWPCDTGYYSEPCPIILARTPATIQLGANCQPYYQDLIIEATAIDTCSPFVQSVLLYYRITGSSAPYTQVSMTRVVDSLYRATIPSSAIPLGTAGMDYYLTATDGQITVSDPPENPYIYPRQIPICPNKAPRFVNVWYPADTCLSPGVDFLIKCKVTDSTNWVDAVHLYYRKRGDILYQDTTMNNSGIDQFFGYVPGSYVVAQGFDYYLRAVDNYGLASYHGDDIHPHLVDACGERVNCNNSYSDPCLVTCPLGDVPFRVYLKDSRGQPVSAYSNVWLDFTGCTGIVACPAQTSWPIVLPDGPSDANGVITFHLHAGGCNNTFYVKVMAGCGLIGYVNIKGLDSDGNQVVTSDDWHYTGMDPCNDYNCNGAVNYWDFEFFNHHFRHVCNLDPCILFSTDLTVLPDTLLPIGGTHTVKLLIKNNNAQACTAQFVKFYRAGFGQGPTLVQFATSYLWKNLLPQDTTTAQASFIVPGPGSGYLLTKFYSNCCSHSMDATFSFTQRICPPDSMRYVFPMNLNTTPAHVETLEYMPSQRWHWSIYYNGGIPDSVVIITPDTSVLGTAGGVSLYFFDSNWNLLGYRKCEVQITLNSGDVNSDCTVNVGDVVYLINYLFKGDQSPDPLRAGDVNCDCLVNISDVVYLINYLFRSGPPPVSSETCGCGYKEWFPR